VTKYRNSIVFTEALIHYTTAAVKDNRPIFIGVYNVKPIIKMTWSSY